MFCLGAIVPLLTSLTGRSPFRSGVRQLPFGLGAAAVTYGIGRLVGTAIG
jgi:VIT1/CCC1 family predicted Fe2+/Mn2+ transporter